VGGLSPPSYTLCAAAAAAAAAAQQQQQQQQQSSSNVESMVGFGQQSTSHEFL
jgi:hypothetical protein